MAEISGLTVTNPALGWAFLVGVAAIAGLPPMGVFMSEFLLVTSTFAARPWLALPLVLGLLTAFGALMLRATEVAFGAPPAAAAPPPAALPALSYVPIYVHLALVVAAGIFLPPALVGWFRHVAGLLG